VPHAELDGRRVFYEEHGSGDPVLLVNGLGADHTAWALQTESLRESFRVVVFDNPGVGQTEGPRGPYTTALFADVAVALLTHLQIERAHVVGASMGGLIAQQIGVRHPAAVRSLAIHCPWWEADPYTVALIRSWQAIGRASRNGRNGCVHAPGLGHDWLPAGERGVRPESRTRRSAPSAAPRARPPTTRTSGGYPTAPRVVGA